jgi:Tfp pilus assembly protein PilW
MLELMVAMAIGLIVISASVGMMKKGLEATSFATERSELQQDVRAASNLMRQDLSMAGAGLPPGGVALPSGGQPTLFGCDQTKCYAGNGAGVAYPGQYMNGIIPGWKLGITVPPSATPTDTITVAYTDSTIALSCYNVTFAAGSGGQSATFTLQSPLSASCQSPPLPVAVQQLSNAQVGLTQGDLVLFTSNVAGNTAYAVAEVTANVTGNGPAYAVPFTANDALRFNQPAAASGDVATIANNGNNTTAQRLLVVTYYLTMDAAGIPRLMRQVSGHSPIPVTDNIQNMQFTYDTYDSSGNLVSASPDGGVSIGMSPSQIRNINILHLTEDSQLRTTGGGYQAVDASTSVSARNMSFQNRYPQ